MMFFSALEIVLLSGSGLFFLLQVLYFCCYLWKPVRYSCRLRKGIIPEGTATPSVSVIVCEQNESENLARFLPAILEQDYPQYEVIVVSMGSSEKSEEVLGAMKDKYRHLYHTYVPEGARLSKKKLAIAIGIKAAKYDVLLFTEASCRPLSHHWIRSMAGNFDGHTDIVTGYGALPKTKGFIGKSSVFDNLISALRAFSLTLMKKPYTARGTNLAYRKDLFLKGKGFQQYLYLQDGADDLFVNSEATPSNMRIAISPESVTMMDACNFDIWEDIKIRQLATRRFYKGGQQMLWNAESATRFGFWIFAVTSFVVAEQWIVISAVVAGLIVIRWCLLGLVVNKAARILQQDEKFYWSIPLLDIARPFFYLYFHISHFFKKKSDYTHISKHGRY
ncbi:MAG: glycosyltransferase [Dysgonamonadaceae bacterium]|jgi:cellulose synthase/poly-beta-1,6-N-acetylglucosamine synthase-like glycosyltransferase|nr:glycosyltransferase [Dysgonamonadaceae bacterium]